MLNTKINSSQSPANKALAKVMQTEHSEFANTFAMFQINTITGNQRAWMFVCIEEPLNRKLWLDVPEQQTLLFTTETGLHLLLQVMGKLYVGDATKKQLK